MKAVQFSEYGDPSVLTLTDIDKPIIKSTQVLVEVHAASINPFDTTIRAGYMKDMIPLSLPVTLGGDIAGVVTEIGEGVTSIAVGDKIYGQANVVAGNSGAFAEYTATAADEIAKIPEGIDYKQAASLPLVGVSAWQAITQHINLQSGQKILIHGGAGGIGTVAIQIAKHLGAYVATTASGEGLEDVKQLGANEVIDYKTQDFSRILRDYDAVFDTAGKEDFSKSLTILKQGGTAVSMTMQADTTKAKEFGITALNQQTKVTTAALDAVRKLVDEGVVKPHIDTVFPLAETKAAFEARENGSIHGKIVIEIQ